MRAYARMHTHTHMHTCTYTHVHTRVHTHTHTGTHRHIRTHTRARAHTHTHTHTHAHTTTTPHTQTQTQTHTHSHIRSTLSSISPLGLLSHQRWAVHQVLVSLDLVPQHDKHCQIFSSSFTQKFKCLAQTLSVLLMQHNVKQNHPLPLLVTQGHLSF